MSQLNKNRRNNSNKNFESQSSQRQLETITSNSQRGISNSNYDENKYKIKVKSSENLGIQKKKPVNKENNNNSSLIVEHDNVDFKENINMLYNNSQFDDNIVEIKENNLRDKIIKYSYCIIWERIPLFSLIFPFYGHLIILNSQGNTYNFGLSKYIEIKREYYGIPIKIIDFNFNDKEKSLWDTAIINATKIFKKKEFSFCGYNSYSFLAEILNKIEYKNKKNYTKFEVIIFSIKKAKYTSNKMICVNYIFIIIIIILICFTICIIFISK